MIPTDLFIVTFARDFTYLKYCLLSIGKFCRRFNYLRVLVPTDDAGGAQDLIDAANIRFPVRVYAYGEKPDKGFLLHMRQIMFADTFSDASRIAHLDADCIFTKDAEPDDFMAPNGKIILRYEPFISIIKRHPPMQRWKECTEACLPFPVLYETMRCHPGVFDRSTYALARKFMEQATGKPTHDYIMAQQNEFPQTFCEFNTLGNVATKQRDLYELIQQSGDAPEPPTPIQQFWAHGPIDKPQEIWTAGKPTTAIPMDIIKRTLSL